METAARQLQSKFEAARALLERGAAAERDCGAAAAHAACGVCAHAASRFAACGAGACGAGACGAGDSRAGACAGDSRASHCAGALAALGALEVRLALATGPIFVAAAGGAAAARAAAAAEYLRVVAAGDFAAAADRAVAAAEAALREGGFLDARAGAAAAGRARARRGAPEHARAAAELAQLLAVYPRGNLEVARAPRPDVERCAACGGPMAVDAARSELRCEDCGALRELVGTVFDDSQFYSQEGQKAKSGTFNPNRHFQFWWSHILAREPEEELGAADGGEALLDTLRAMVVRDRRVLRLLTVNDVRAMLREAGQTELNKNVPLILKKLTGVGPPQVPEAFAVRVENLFTKAIEIGERVRRAGRVNRNYYPYYIYRIVEALTTDHEIRRVLYYIYIQSRDTVDADDADWELICAELREIEYKPTDRTLGDKYAPI